MLFEPNQGRELFSGASTRLTVYSVPDMEKVKSMSKSADVIYGIDFRSDGKLFALGNSAGNIQVFDSASKKLIRNLKGHKGPVRKVKFSPNKVNLFSISDDKTFKVWDIPTESEIISIDAHDDYIRACAIIQNGKYFITGSYDHKIKIWNIEDNYSLVMAIDNGAPIEDLLVSANGSIIIAAGSNMIKFWDISAGGNLIHSMSPHQKTITSIVLNSDCSHLITAGLDRLSKIIDLSTYRVVQSFKFDSPVMCVSCNKNDSALSFGLANGHAVLKSRKISLSLVTPITTEAIKFDFVAPRKQLKFTNYEKAFKAFKFKDALDECLNVGNPQLIVSCFTELIVFNALNIALNGRDEMGLLPILKFISKSVQNPEFCHVSLEVFSEIIDIYGCKIGQSPEIDDCMAIILNKMEREIKIAKEMTKVSGQLEMICASSLRSEF